MVNKASTRGVEQASGSHVQLSEALMKRKLLEKVFGWMKQGSCADHAASTGCFNWPAPRTICCYEKADPDSSPGLSGETCRCWSQKRLEDTNIPFHKPPIDETEP